MVESRVVRGWGGRESRGVLRGCGTEKGGGILAERERCRCYGFGNTEKPGESGLFLGWPGRAHPLGGERTERRTTGTGSHSASHRCSAAISGDTATETELAARPLAQSTGTAVCGIARAMVWDVGGCQLTGLPDRDARTGLGAARGGCAGREFRSKRGDQHGSSADERRVLVDRQAIPASRDDLQRAGAVSLPVGHSGESRKKRRVIDERRQSRHLAPRPEINTPQPIKGTGILSTVCVDLGGVEGAPRRAVRGNELRKRALSPL